MPSWFDADVDALETRLRQRDQLEKAIVFYGSSSLTLWPDIESHFPDYNVINHGFGGSTMADCLEYFDRLVIAVRPTALIVYAGDNDLEQGTSPEALLAMLQSMVERKRNGLGTTPMAYLSVKVSPARLHFMHRIGYANRILERAIGNEADVTFLDITRRMVSCGMKRWEQYFTHDPLHMNARGYRVWGKSVSEYLHRLQIATGDLRVRSSGATPAWAACEQAGGIPAIRESGGFG